MCPAQPISDSRCRDYPALRRLRLGDEDLATLPGQGFISREAIGTTTRYKLRFRRASGEQVVRYIRSIDLDDIRRELAELQAGRRAEWQLRRLNRTVKKVLQYTKLERPIIAARHGLRFHGRRIRLKRQLHLAKQNGSASIFCTKEVCMSTMDDLQGNDAAAAGDRALNEGLGAAASEQQRLRDSESKFTALLADLRDEMLENPDREQAGRGYIKTTVLASIFYSDKGIMAVVKPDPKSIVENRDVREALKNHRGLLHEYERFDSLDMRIAQQRAARENALRRDPLREAGLRSSPR
jgi:hypothetical protein